MIRGPLQNETVDGDVPPAPCIAEGALKRRAEQLEVHRPLREAPGKEAGAREKSEDQEGQRLEHEKSGRHSQHTDSALTGDFIPFTGSPGKG